MDTPSTSLRRLAQQLLAFEATHNSDVDRQGHAAVRVVEKLRISLTRFAGAEGFASLLRRALTLAGQKVPSLQTVTIKPDGSVEGLEAFATDARNGGTDAAAALTAQLLGLLVTFIGESLTLRLVRESWPDASLEN